MKKITQALAFICLIYFPQVGGASDYEIRPFVEVAQSLGEDQSIALVRVKEKTSSYIDFELIEVLIGKSIEKKEFRAYTMPDFALRANHSGEGTEWILTFFKFPVTIEGKTKKRMCYSAMNALRYMKGLVYGQITEAEWGKQQEMTMKELRNLLKEKI